MVSKLELQEIHRFRNHFEVTITKDGLETIPKQVTSNLKPGQISTMKKHEQRNHQTEAKR